jgi:N6-L-threonylcarbamoyladenine synthase
MIHTQAFDFSFSGIKTAVLYLLRDSFNVHNRDEAQEKLSDEIRNEICREFEDAVTEVVITKLTKAVRAYSPTALLIGGGVSANTYLRQKLTDLGKELGIPVHIPHHHVTGDNALMIAVAGYMSSQTYTQEIVKNTAKTSMKAEGTLSLS